jgi:hypothetical protein
MTVEMPEEIKAILIGTDYEEYVDLSLTDLVTAIINDVLVYTEKEKALEIEREAQREIDETIAAVQQMCITHKV